MALSSLFLKEIVPTKSKCRGAEIKCWIFHLTSIWNSCTPGYSRVSLAHQKNYLFLAFMTIIPIIEKGILKPVALCLHEVTKGKASEELI